MVRRLAIIFATGMLFAVPGSLQAGDTRARADYMIHCQGCHVPDGSGFPGKVPDLRTSLGDLLAAEGGRAFLVQVPGSAQSSLSDERLAAVLNWMVITFSDPQVADFQPYSAEEIGTFRKTRLTDVTAIRSSLVGDGRPSE